MLCNTVNVMSYEYSYEYSEFMSFERTNRDYPRPV